MEDSKRIYFLDTLRSFVIFLVIFYHVTIHYVTPFQLPMFVRNDFPKAYGSFFGIIFMITNGPTLNSIMFFIAGYFAVAPLIKNGAKHFFKDKLRRLGIPYVIGVIILTPLAQFIAYRSWGNSMNYFQYWFGEFFKPQHYLQYQFWFLGVLLFFMIVWSLVFSVSKNKFEALEMKAAKPSRLFLICFIAITTGLYMAVEHFYSAVNFTNLYVIYFQTVMLLVYAAYFCLGIYAHKKDWFKAGYKPKVFPWTMIYIVSILIYLITLITAIRNHSGHNPTIVRAVMDLSFNVSIFSALLMSLAFCQKYGNGGTPFWRIISRSSYSAYCIHFLIVCFLIYASRNIPLPLFPKYFIQIVAGTVISWGMGYAFKRTPGLSKVL